MNLSERIDTIESGYEFMLAYAAQGRETDRDAGGSGAGFELREFLQKNGNCAGRARCRNYVSC